MTETKTWTDVSHKLPPDDQVVETKIDDQHGERNTQRLKRRGSLWFLSGGSMYVYYTPTHWRHTEQEH